MFQLEGVAFAKRHAAADARVMAKLGTRGGVDERGALVRIQREEGGRTRAPLSFEAVREPDAHASSRLVHRPNNPRVVDRGPRRAREPLDRLLALPVREQGEREATRSAERVAQLRAADPGPPRT